MAGLVETGSCHMAGVVSFPSQFHRGLGHHLDFTRAETHWAQPYDEVSYLTDLFGTLSTIPEDGDDDDGKQIPVPQKHGTKRKAEFALVSLTNEEGVRSHVAMTSRNFILDSGCSYTMDNCLEGMYDVEVVNEPITGAVEGPVATRKGTEKILCYRMSNGEECVRETSMLYAKDLNEPLLSMTYEMEREGAQVGGPDGIRLTIQKKTGGSVPRSRRKKIEAGQTDGAPKDHRRWRLGAPPRRFYVHYGAIF